MPSPHQYPAIHACLRPVPALASRPPEKACRRAPRRIAPIEKTCEVGNPYRAAAIDSVAGTGTGGAAMAVPGRGKASFDAKSLDRVHPAGAARRHPARHERDQGQPGEHRDERSRLARLHAEQRRFEKPRGVDRDARTDLTCHDRHCPEARAARHAARSPPAIRTPNSRESTACDSLHVSGFLPASPCRPHPPPSSRKKHEGAQLHMS